MIGSRQKRSHPHPLPATTTVKVRLQQQGRARHVPAKTLGRGTIPRVARLLALGHKIDGMIRSGDLKDWAEAARLIGITRARMTQIANLMLLEPGIQESILGLAPPEEVEQPVTERAFRNLLTVSNWKRQRSIHSTNTTHQSSGAQ